MALETDKVASISTWSAESTPSLHATEHNALHTAYNSGVGGVTMVVGTQAGDVINVTLQLEDNDGDDLAALGYVFAFLSDAATGIAISSAAPDVGVTIGTDGAIIVAHTANLAWTLQSEADGDIDLDIEDATGTPTWYLVVVLPDGSQVISDAITFT